MSRKSVQGSRGTRTPTVRCSLPSRGLGLPSGTSRPSSPSPSRLHQHRVQGSSPSRTASYCRSFVSRTIRGRQQGPVIAAGADMHAVSINVSYVAKQQHAPVDTISLWVWHFSFFLR